MCFAMKFKQQAAQATIKSKRQPLAVIQASYSSFKFKPPLFAGVRSSFRLESSVLRIQQYTQKNSETVAELKIHLKKALELKEILYIFIKSVYPYNCNYDIYVHYKLPT